MPPVVLKCSGLHYEYASAVIIDLIFPGVKQRMPLKELCHVPDWLDKQKGR